MDIAITSKHLISSLEALKNIVIHQSILLTTTQAKNRLLIIELIVLINNLFFFANANHYVLY